MAVATALTIFAAILQAASQNIAMFVISGILIGIGTCSSGIAGMIHGQLEKYHD
jgi:hypothetical protein